MPLDGCFPLAPSFDHAGPMARDVEGCERMMEALAPGFAPVDVSLGDLRVGVAWTERADPLVRARVEAVAEGFERVEVPWPDGVYPAFSREIVEVHADLYPDDRYDPGIAHKMDIARAVHRRAGGGGEGGARALPRADRGARRRPARHADRPDGRAPGRASATSRCASG